MGQNTMIRIKDRKNVQAIVSRTRNMVLLALFLAAGFLVAMRLKAEGVILSDGSAPVTANTGDSLAIGNDVKLVSPPEFFAQRPAAIGMGKPYDIRDPAVVFDLTGKLMQLGDDPLAALPYTRKWDSQTAGLQVPVFHIEMKDPSTDAMHRLAPITPESLPTPVNPIRPIPEPAPGPGPEPGPGPDPDPVTRAPDPGPEAPQPERRDELPEPEPDPDATPQDISVAFERMNVLVNDGNARIKEWYSCRDDNRRNAALREAQHMFSQARDGLRELADRYPDFEPVQRLLNEALQGRFFCAKHRTQ